MEEVPSDLIINWDQTSVHYIPISQWTMEKQGTKHVKIVAADDKKTNYNSISRVPCW